MARRYASQGSDELIAMATSVPARIARVDDHIGVLARGKLADLLVINTSGDKPLDAVVRAKPSDIMLVVGGQALDGDPALLAQLQPGAKLEPRQYAARQGPSISAKAMPPCGGRACPTSRTS